MSERFAVRSIKVTSEPFSGEMAKPGVRLWVITVDANIGSKQCAISGDSDGFNWLWFERAMQRWIAEPRA